ncbi:hypothetical protein AB0E69_10420 [Kribbella sp. NPDC026611]|uniref:hypothetical protein n=1 Tax=Kribbella sp. NPDC026611 TaxID=3154911 RepID=UPI0034038B99
MSVRVELWIEGRLVGGAEQWWDDITATLRGMSRSSQCSRGVDPYIDVLFEREELTDLAAEAHRFSHQAPDHLRPFLQKLAELCREGSRAATSELRFLGD